jgi:hypothetical protein
MELGGSRRRCDKSQMARPKQIWMQTLIERSHIRRINRLSAAAALIVGMWLTTMLPAGRAEQLYQTVPTMPPPTYTVSPTSPMVPSPTNPAGPSATSPVLPSVTAAQVTGEVPTQGEPGAIASATLAESVAASSPVPEGTQAAGSPTPTAGGSTGSGSTIPEVTQTPGGGIAEAGGTGVLVGVIIGGVVLVMVIVGVVVVLSGGKKR